MKQIQEWTELISKEIQKKINVTIDITMQVCYILVVITKVTTNCVVLRRLLK